DSSGPALSEMIVRGEIALLRQRYKGIIVLTASVSGLAAVAYVLCNSLFVSVWTSLSHKTPVHWPLMYDVLLGTWMIVMALLHAHISFVLWTKEVGFSRYIYFFEGLIFVVCAYIGAKWGGLWAIILCSLICSSLFSGAYGVWRISQYFGYSVREVA